MKLSTIAFAHLTILLVASAQPTGPRPQGPGGPSPYGLPLMEALDANGDGQVDAAELGKASESLKKLDQDKDGTLSAEELRPRLAGRRPGVGDDVPRPGRGMGGRGPRSDTSRGGAFTSLPQANSETERKILGVLDDMFRNQRRGSMSVPQDDGRILRVLAEALGAKHVVEIGTSVGYSGTWLALALAQTGGRLTTYEIDAGRAAQARENFRRAGVSDRVTLVEGDAHAEVTKLTEPIDLLFLDADKEGYLDYLEKLLPQIRPGGLIVAHNINPSQADPRYVRAITTNPALETLFLNLETSGISVTLKKH